MRKLLSVFLVLVLTVTLFAGCGTKANENEIVIGLNYELSGAAASYGSSSVEGIELAFEQINAAGGINGKQVVLKKYDNKSDAAEATTLTTKLMTQDNVVMVLGPATSGAFKATIPVSTKNKIPVASGSATADDVTVDASGVKEYAYRICFSDSVQGNAMAVYAVETLGAKNAVIIMDSSSDYGKGLAANFKSTFEQRGGTVVAEEAYVAGDTDFNAILTKIRGESFDVIYIPGYYEEAGLIIKQARALGINTPILGADGFESPVLMELAGAEALNDIYYSNHYSSADENPAVQKFIQDYKGKYNKEPDCFAALGYDLANLVTEAIKNSSSLKGEDLNKAIAATSNFEGITGDISIDENHNAVKDIMIIKLKDGVQDSVERVSK